MARADIWGIACAVVLPALLTWIYFVALADAATVLQQTVYLVGKILQFSLPVIFLRLVLGRRIRLPTDGSQGLTEGVVSGLLIFCSLLLLYWSMGRVGAELLADLSPRVAAKVTGLGVATPLRYVALGVFYSLAHSFLEEYYWRWFVFGRLRLHLSSTWAITLSSLAFAAHHLVLMGVYAGWDSPYTYLFTFAIAAGGAYWAWLYERSGSIVAPWLSHLLVDAAIFAIGYDLL